MARTAFNNLPKTKRQIAREEREASKPELVPYVHIEKKDETDEEKAANASLSNYGGLRPFECPLF